MAQETLDGKAKQALKEQIQSIKSKMRITKVISTRAVKTKAGDFFVGYASEWDSVQDDGALGLDQMLPSQSSGLSMEEAKIARLLLAMEVDIAAHEAALMGGALSAKACEDAVTAIKANFVKLAILNTKGEK